MSHFIVNAAFSNNLTVNFLNFIIVYTDGSLSPLSTGYAFYILVLHVSLTNNLSSSFSSLTAECYTVIEALTF